VSAALILSLAILPVKPSQAFYAATEMAGKADISKVVVSHGRLIRTTFSQFELNKGQYIAQVASSANGVLLGTQHQNSERSSARVFAVTGDRLITRVVTAESQMLLGWTSPSEASLLSRGPLPSSFSLGSLRVVTYPSERDDRRPYRDYVKTAEHLASRLSKAGFQRSTSTDTMGGIYANTFWPPYRAHGGAIDPSGKHFAFHASTNGADKLLILETDTLRVVGQIPVERVHTMLFVGDYLAVLKGFEKVKTCYVFTLDGKPVGSFQCEAIG
jgi:hypothetical protein